MFGHLLRTRSRDRRHLVAPVSAACMLPTRGTDVFTASRAMPCQLSNAVLDYTAWHDRVPNSVQFLRPSRAALRFLGRQHASGRHYPVFNLRNLSWHTEVSS